MSGEPARMCSFTTLHNIVGCGVLGGIYGATNIEASMRQRTSVPIRMPSYPSGQVKTRY